MNVLISFCGIGFGHASRCTAVGNELEKQGFRVLYSTHEPTYSRLIKNLNIKMTRQELKMEENEREIDVLKTFFETTKNIRKISENIKTQLKLIDDFDIDIVLSDGYISSIPAAKLRKKPVLFMTNQTNGYTMFNGVFYNIPKLITKILLKNTIKFSDICLIPDFTRPYTICRKNINFFGLKKKFYFTGPVIRKYYDEVKEKTLPENTYLVCFGGVPPKTRIDKFLKEIDANFIFINSKYNKKENNITFKKYVENIFPYLKASTGVITHGGHTTLMEALSFGKPVIGVCFKKLLEQANNLSGIEKQNVGIKLRNPEHIKRAFEEIGKKRKRAKKFRSLAKKHNGVKNIIKIIDHLITS